MDDLVIGIGGNQGNRSENLSKCRAGIETHLGEILQKSSLIESEPWGYKSDKWFLNQTLLVKCNLEPAAILRIINEIESDFGRVRTEEYTDRPLDIDILFYGDLVMDNSDLQVPHPRLHDRLFIMKPLAELLPDFIHPLLRKSCKEILSGCTDSSVCRWYT